MPVLASSLLSIVELGLAPYSLRGITQTLEHISQASATRRTINGTLRDVSAPQFRKYTTTIRCSDLSSPGFDNVWPGMALTVHCAIEIAVEGDTGTSGLGRNAVPGSIREDSGFTFYRPILSMLLQSYRTEFAEWDAEYSWEMTLEEV